MECGEGIRELGECWRHSEEILTVGRHELGHA